MRLTLPKKHVSWSQVSAWRKSKKGYIDRYYYGAPMYETEELQFGKFLATCMDGNEFSLSKEEIKIVQPILDGRPREVEIRIQRHVNDKEYTIKGFVDGGLKDGVFHEYKTGKTHEEKGDAWTLERAQKHGQLLLYSYHYLLETGAIPAAKLHWLETKRDSNDNVVLTGRHEVFEVKYTAEQITQFMREFDATVLEISNHFQRWTKNELSWMDAR